MFFAANTRWRAAPAIIIAAFFACLASVAAEARGGVAQASPDPAVNSCNVDVLPQRLPRLVLDIAVTCNVRGDLTLRAGGVRMARFVSEVRGAQTMPVDRLARDWTVAARRGFQPGIAYRFDLDAYLDEADRVTTGLRRGDTRLALLDTWLLQPLADGLALPVAIHVRQTPETRFATALPYSAGRWRLPDIRVRFAGYTVFGNFSITSIPVAPPGSLAAAVATGSAPMPPATIDLVTMDGGLDAPATHVADWVRQSAAAVAGYFDGYSAAQSLLVLLPTSGSGVPFGRVVPGGGISMVVLVGESASARGLYGEWVLIHEMIHTATPFIYGRGTWIMEGLATFLEPVIRARAGWKTEADVWREWIANMDRGVRSLTETGLSNTNSPYWGGALFMLLADIEIRRATALRLGLEDCLRSVLHGGANAVERWSVEQMLGACDQLTGAPVLAALAARFVDRPSSFDLAGLWRDLGVDMRDGMILYDDRAPLAAIRRTIVNGLPSRQGRAVPLGRF